VILRAAAALAWSLSTAIFLAFAGELGKSPWSPAADRHLRAMKDRTTAPVTVTPMTYADFAALPHGLPLAAYAQLETRGASVEGYVQIMSRISDGDYGIAFVPTPPKSVTGDTLAIVIELTPQWQRGSRNWRIDRLMPELRSHDWGLPPWPNGPRKARLSGWLLYDYPHDPQYRGARREPGESQGTLARRLTGWEIHPVTRIELWDDSLGAFLEYPR
jgi:hypothetical protein